MEKTATTFIRVLRLLRVVARRPQVWLLFAMSLAYAPLFDGRIIFFRDPAFWNFPARFFVSRALRQGHIPHWNPSESLGFSVWANPLYGLLYPPNWLYVLVPDDLVASAVTWQSFAHNVWGGLGMIVLARKLRCSSLACFVAGSVWSLCGYTTSMWSAGLLLLAGAWVPWCAVGFLSLAEELARPAGNKAWGLVKATLPVGMSLLMGEVFVAGMGVAFGLLTLAAAVATRSIATSVTTKRAALQLAGFVAVACVVGGLLGAAVIVPAAKALGTTDRAVPLTRQMAEASSVHPLRLVEFVAPGTLGNPYGNYVAGEVVGERSLGWRPLAYGSYLGAGSVLLALWALRRRHKFVWILAAFAVAALLVSFGRHLPLHAVLRTVIPPMARMRYPEKYLAMFTCWFALLAAFGMARIEVEHGAFVWRRALSFVFCLACLSLGAPLALSLPWASAVRSGVWISLAVTAACLAVLLLLGKRIKAAAPAFVAVIVALDLTIALWDLQPFVSTELANRIPPAASFILQENKNDLAPARVYRASAVETMMARIKGDATVPETMARSALTLVGNLNTRYGLASLPGYDAAIPRETMKIWALGKTRAVRALRLFGVRYAVMPVDEQQAHNDDSGFTSVMTPFPNTRLFRVFEPNPRVLLAGASKRLPDESARTALFDPEVVVGDLIILPEGQGREIKGDGTVPGDCQLTQFLPSHIEARCSAKRATYALFVEQWAQGWAATVDDKPAPIVRANVVMRAVEVPAGEHKISMSFRPPGMVMGLGIAAFGLATLAAFTVLALLNFARQGRINR